MFYFVIDEIDSARVLNRFLREILAAGGPSRKCITAYATGRQQSPGSASINLKPGCARLVLEWTKWNNF
jgi:hypothetical protein